MCSPVLLDRSRNRRTASTPPASPLSVYVSTFKAAQGDLFVAKMSAAATAAVVPVLIAGWLAQRQLVTGLTMGAVK